MTMQITTAVGNSRKREASKVLRKYQSSRNYRIKKMPARDALGLRSYRNRDVTGEHECMN